MLGLLLLQSTFTFLPQGPLPQRPAIASRCAPPEALGVIPAAAATTLAAAVLPSLRIVSTGDTELVERLGVYKRALQPGLHFLIPVVDRISFKATTREQVLDIKPQPAITSDNAPLQIDAVMYWKIFDPELTRYKVTDLQSALTNLVITQLRSEIGKLTLDQTFTARESMNAALLETIDRATGPWGVTVLRVEVQSITPNREILSAMELQMSAERKKRAQVLQSEGERTAAVNAAQGEADAVRLEAQAAAEAVKLKAEAEVRRVELEAEGAARGLQTLTEANGGNVDAALQVLLLSKYWETQGALATSDNAKVLFFPSKATVPLTYEGLKEVVQGSE